MNNILLFLFVIIIWFIYFFIEYLLKYLVKKCFDYKLSDFKYMKYYNLSYKMKMKYDSLSYMKYLEDGKKLKILLNIEINNWIKYDNK